MTIGARVSGTVDRMELGDPEGALFQICAAIEATATSEHGKRGRGSYKTFVSENLPLITDIAFGGQRIENLNLGYDHPELKLAPGVSATFQDILYHVVRCGLYHEAKLPEDIEFAEDNRFTVERGVKLVLPRSLIYGLITAVVVAPSNEEQTARENIVLNLGDFPVPLNMLWGRRKELLWLLDVEREVKRLGRIGNAS